MLDVRRLRVLREVARQGSLSAAATALGYTQPAVSRQIAVLEAEVGVQLLQRLPGGTVLTEPGRMLVQRAGEVMLSLSRAEDELRAHAGLDGGTLRMAAFASGAATMFPLALARFRERHPQVELIVEVADPIDSLPPLRAGELDLALCHSMADGGSRGAGRRSLSAGGLTLEAVPLFEDPMLIALPASHPLATAPELRLEDLADESWMLCSTESCPDVELFLGACATAGVKPRVAFQYDDYAALLGFVAAGVGVSVIPDMVARSARADVVIRAPAPPVPPRAISAAVTTEYRSSAVTAMLEVLLELAPEWTAGQSTGQAGATRA